MDRILRGWLAEAFGQPFGSLKKHPLGLRLEQGHRFWALNFKSGVPRGRPPLKPNSRLVQFRHTRKSRQGFPRRLSPLRWICMDGVGNLPCRGCRTHTRRPMCRDNDPRCYLDVIGADVDQGSGAVLTTDASGRPARYVFLVLLRTIRLRFGGRGKDI
jgi:hypothetical protein